MTSRGKMTSPSERAARAWQDPTFAHAWAAEDRMGDFLALPRAIAAAVVALEGPAPRCVVDVASGPGAFLAVFLERFPSARGVWTDASEAMLQTAQAELARYRERVAFGLGDMSDLASAGVSGDVDVIVTSRALHHLDAAGIGAFYREAAAHLAPGGWLINLDHVGLADGWQERMRAVRPQFVRPNPATREGRHHHPSRLATMDDHLQGYAAAGIHDVDVPWRAFSTALFMGRKTRALKGGGGTRAG